MIEEIVNSFKNLTTFGWVSQIFGLLAFVVLIVGYLFPKKKFLLFAVAAHVFFLFESAFALLFVNSIVTSINLIRYILITVLLYRFGKEVSKNTVYIFFGVTIVFTFAYIAITKTWTDVSNYFPMIGSSIVTLTVNSKNEYVVKAGGILNESTYLVFFAFSRLPFSTLRQVILVISGTIGLILLIIKKVKANNQENQKSLN